MVQTIIVSVVVAGSVLHAGWILMPRSMRQLLAQQILALDLTLPDCLSKTVQDAAVAHGGCACHGCEHATQSVNRAKTPISATKAQAVVFHRPPRQSDRGKDRSA